ncbi:entry exclusion protein TrbK [Phyllobacterium endophyticum]|uniref:Entry exclusion protein TrbK n=1 Tax=Phyllobacterium endophyticum TaxID=1149773 RepID=A0A2P7AKC3_9HYPH|nr:entry exclusion protein TrbK [Phyllobacterium endophyticum]MBB3237130.1 Ti type entry exclusion protein TrbK [Phyllobacterium endophyticum]PSH54642.1 entry exclusion protein TrbK [Phyllobacterium endophyticum]TYR40590.1 entry exclusion protein TrbK [Phyllobacterium endophyticum]
MVISKRFFIVVLFAVAAGAGGAVWLFSQSDDPSRPSPGSAASGSLHSDDGRKRAAKFFSGQKNYDLTGGQEMKPRW